MTRDHAAAHIPLPGDVNPLGPPDPTADILARVYALILSWPLPDEDAEPEEAKE